MKQKEVTNIKYKICEPMKANLIGNFNLETDISQAVSYLIKKEYHVKNFCVSHKFTKGIVFIHSE